MTTLREAVAQALDALTKIHPGNMSWETGDAWMNAVQILREALAQPAQEPVADESIGEVAIQDTQYHGYAMAIKPHIKDVLPEGTKLYTAPPQRPAKPVGWLRAIDEAMVVHNCGVADPSDDYETAKHKLNTLLCIAQDIGSYFASQQQPPQRKPLTDETLWEMWVESPSDVLRFACAIEQAHGIGDKE